VVHFMGGNKPQVADLPLSFRSLVAEFDSRLGYVIAPEKADAMRTALAFVRAVQKERWDDAQVLLRGMIDGDGPKTNPLTNFAAAMGVMATLLCNELDITDEWVDARLYAVNWLETHDE
jgi:hypothetical protein